MSDLDDGKQCKKFFVTLGRNIVDDLVEERIAPVWEKCEVGVGQGTGARRKRMEKEGRGKEEEEGKQERGPTSFFITSYRDA